MSNFPEVGSTWRHRNGAMYRVIHLANFYSNNVLYPLTVVYQGVGNGKVWSRPMDQWHRSMVLLQDAPREAQGAQAVDERAAFERKVQDLAERWQPDYRRYGDVGEYKNATMEWAWTLWMMRAALATQPAVRGAEHE